MPKAEVVNYNKDAVFQCRFLNSLVYSTKFKQDYYRHVYSVLYKHNPFISMPVKLSSF